MWYNAVINKIIEAREAQTNCLGFLFTLFKTKIFILAKTYRIVNLQSNTLMIKQIKLKNLPLDEVYKLIEPGPVVMISTFENGKANLMTMSWKTMIDFNPPIIGIVMSENNFSFKALSQTKQCVICLPDAKIAKQVVKVGNCSGRDTDKFKKFKFTPLPAEKVKAPLVAECFANIECQVVDDFLAQKYNFFVLKAVKAWINPSIKNPKMFHHIGNKTFVLDGKISKINSRMK